MVDGDRLTTEAVCEALGCGALEKATYLMPPTSELSPGATSGNISSAGNMTWAQAPTVRCSGANWQLCKVADDECSGDKRLVRVTCAGTCAHPLTPPQFRLQPLQSNFGPQTSTTSLPGCTNSRGSTLMLRQIVSLPDLSITSDGLQTPPQLDLQSTLLVLQSVYSLYPF